MRKIYFLMRRIFLLPLVFLSIGLFSAQAQNLLNNGDFENGDQGWTHGTGGSADATFSVVTNDVANGSNALRVQVNTLGSNPWDIQSISTPWQATPGKDYQLTIYAKADANGKTIRLINQTNEYQNHSITLTNSWQLYTWTFTALEAEPSFRLNYNFSTGTYHIDNISIVELETIEPPTLETSLKELGEYCGLNVGTAVADGPLRYEEYYRNTIIQQFGMVVAENEMKMETIKPTENGDYNFTAGDRLVEFAQEHGMQVRGHALLWHSQMPRWMTERQWTRDQLMNYLKEYITTVVTRYKGQIQEWDVANEVIDDGRNNALRDALWFNVGGEAILDSAFKWAHAADPNCKLYYNDYSAETMNSKSDAVYNLVKGLKERGAPIYGVGFQSHRNWNEGGTMNSNLITQMDQNIKRLADLGLKVAITELDLGINTPVSEQDYQTQATTYGNILQLALNNRPTIETFCLWGFTDKHSWIPGFSNGERDEALIFDANYFPKPAYNALVETFENCTPPVVCEAAIQYNGEPSICEGGSLELEGPDGANYVWRKDGERVGAEQTYLVTESGSYTLEVTFQSGCNTTSEAVEVSVIPKPVIILTSPDLEGVYYEPASFNISANAEEGVQGTWKLFVGSGGLQDENAASDSFSHDVEGLEAGEYNYTLVLVTEDGCTDTLRFDVNIDQCLQSRTYTNLTIDDQFYPELNSATVKEGSTVILQPDGEGAGSWSWTGPNNFTSDISTPQISNFSLENAGEYRATYTNECGAETTVTFTLAFCHKPEIHYEVIINENEVHELTEVNVREGDHVVLSPLAPEVQTGPDPIEDQSDWSWTGPNDFASSTRELVFESISHVDAGIYTATFTSSCGEVNSIDFTINIEDNRDCNGDVDGTAEVDECGVCAGGETGIEPGYICAEPAIEALSQNIEIEEGEELLISVSASGPGELTYQWYRNNTAIEGATENTFRIAETSVENSGTYYVIVSNENGETQSNNIEVTIRQAVDCNGVEGGTAYIDDCGECAGGNTGVEPGYSCAEPEVEVVTADVNIGEGESFTLEVSATGPGENTYQWFRNGQPIEGANEQSYSVPSASVENAGTYYIEVTNENGTTRSSDIEVTVIPAPEVDCNGVEGGSAAIDECGVCAGGNTGLEPGYSCSEPEVEVVTQEVNVEEGESLILEVSVSGPGENTYQWFRNGMPIDGATESSYSVPSASVESAGTYYVEVTNENGTTRSSDIEVTVNTETPEVDCNGVEGGSAEIDECGVCAGGNTGLEPGYSCSEPEVEVMTPVVNVEEGESFTIEVSVSGPGENSYQWFRNGQPIEGATESFYSVPSASLENAGTYYVEVTNENGTTRSSDIEVTVNTETPEVDCNGVEGGSAAIDECGVCAGGNTGIEPGYSCSEPEVEVIIVDVNIEEGESFTLEVSATGPGENSYQWFRNGMPIDGATESSYSVPSASVENAGTYYVEVTNENGTTRSSDIEVTVTSAPEVDCNGVEGGTAQIDECGVCAGGNTGIEPGYSCEKPEIISLTGDVDADNGESFTLAVSASGPGKITYQWYRNGQIIPEATANSYFVSVASEADAGTYHVEITNENGTTRSSDVEVTVITPEVDCNGVEGGTAAIDICGICAGGNTGIEPDESCPIENPEIVSVSSQTEATLGESFTISVNATGQGSFTYQWYHNGVPIDDATERSYTIGEVSDEHAGTYYVVVYSSNGGEARSEDREITVAEPRDCNGDAGGTAYVDACGNCAGGNTGVEPIDDEEACNTTSINPAEIVEKVKLYPNPTSTELFIEHQKMAERTISVFNSLGKQILSFESNDVVEKLNVSQLPSGVYLLRIHSSEGLQQVKFVVN